MSKLKSLDALRELQKKVEGSVDLRKVADSPDKIRVAVGMATCGIAVGARDTMRAFLEELKAQSIDNAAVVQTGCIGLCLKEPIVEVSLPGKAPVLYGAVTPEVARKIVQEHIKGGKVLADMVIEAPAKQL